MSATPLRPAVFLDRDGTLVEDVDYLSRPEQLRLIPGAAAAIRLLNDRGVPVVVVSNQSAIARGLLTEGGLVTVHAHLRTLLAAEGARLDAIYYCPHHPEAANAAYRQMCDCRKPAPGMLLKAACEHGLDLAASTMIGDSLRDLEAGNAAGCKTLILVRTGYGEKDKARIAELPRARLADDLMQAVRQLG